LRVIPDEVKRQILGLWLGGITVRQISIETKVSTGEISNIISAQRKGNLDLDELRKLHLALGEAKTTLPDALRGAEFLRTLDKLEFDGKHLPECLNFIKKTGERAPELASAGGRLIELEKKSGKSYDRFLLEFNEQLKAQADLSEKVKSLEGRDLELRHLIHSLQKLRTLQETIDKNNITPDTLETLIRDSLQLQALHFTTQQAGILARELAQRGLDPATASAQVARLLREYSDLEGAKDKAETEAKRWQLALDKVRNDTASLQEESERLKEQLRKLEDTHRERRELLEKQYKALESKLQTEHAARKQELETGLLAGKREIETEVQGLQNKASELKTEIERSEAKLESAKTRMSDAEAQLQRIEQSIAKSRILATVALLVEDPSSLKTPGNVVETVVAISEGFKKYLETGLTSWRNRLTLKDATERLLTALGEEVTR
jgi:predicted  nucleic acid-binding Zn-ribbon protein